MTKKELLKQLRFKVYDINKFEIGDYFEIGNYLIECGHDLQEQGSRKMAKAKVAS